MSTYNFGSDATATDFFFTNRFNPSLEYQSNLVILVVVVLLVVLIIEKKTYESHLTGRTGSGWIFFFGWFGRIHGWSESEKKTTTLWLVRIWTDDRRKQWQLNDWLLISCEIRLQPAGRTVPVKNNRQEERKNNERIDEEEEKNTHTRAMISFDLSEKFVRFLFSDTV